jgi:glycerophosphoryl diester phosphodiesterase
MGFSNLPSRGGMGLAIGVSLLLGMTGHGWLSSSPLLALLVYQSLKREKTTQATADAFFAGLRVGGHRGSPTIFPENSMASFAQAKEDGVDLIEFDVSMTKDGYAVILHDDDLDRTTNMKGAIREKNLSELKNCNIAAHFKRTGPSSAPIKAEGLPSLESLVSWSTKNKMKMLFDVKDYDPELTQIIVELFSKYDLYKNSIVCSFFPWVVYRVKRADNRILTGLTWRNKFFSYADDTGTTRRFDSIPRFYSALLIDYVYQAALKTFLPSFLGVELMLTNNHEISVGYVLSQRAKGLEVMAWTVNDVNEMHWMLETLKIPILTDLPYHIKTLAHLKKFGQENGYVEDVVAA